MKFKRKHISITYKELGEIGLGITLGILGGIALAEIFLSCSKNTRIYLECQECKKKFITRRYIYEQGVFCPKCDSPNIAKVERFINP